MWSDKETKEDFLEYTVHAGLLKSVATNDKNLPITVGLYGDWEGGKSFENQLYFVENKKSTLSG